SCSKKVEQPAIPVQESTNSTPYGTVWLVDKYGELSSNNSGVKVTLTGNNVNLSVLSGVDGRFQFNDVPEGKYLMQFSKEGFATTAKTTTVKGYFYTGSTILGPIATHDIFITDATLAFNKIILQMSALPAPAKYKPTGYLVFASNNPDVSAENAPYASSNNSENITEQYLDVDQLVKAGINMNAPIYLALYPNTFNVTKSNVDGIITYPTIKLEGKKSITVNK
ncbi:MAG: hypothetical protein FYV88_4590, partial [Bacteroidetes bacterium]|nr:hypothetical protein [Bacteroidota bacterium]